MKELYSVPDAIFMDLRSFEMVLAAEIFAFYLSNHYATVIPILVSSLIFTLGGF